MRANRRAIAVGVGLGCAAWAGLVAWVLVSQSMAHRKRSG